MSPLARIVAELGKDACALGGQATNMLVESGAGADPHVILLDVNLPHAIGRLLADVGFLMRAGVLDAGAIAGSGRVRLRELDQIVSIM